MGIYIIFVIWAEKEKNRDILSKIELNTSEYYQIDLRIWSAQTAETVETAETAAKA